MDVRPLAPLPEVLLIEPEVHADGRGYFLETWQRERYADAGVDVTFVQDNHSRSRPDVLRGLHFQHPRAQGKLIQVLRGEVYDVVVDVRVDSPTFGRWSGRVLSEENHRQLWVPEGFAHGFVALDEGAAVHYKCTDFYAPGTEHTLRWDDPRVDIDWPVDDPVLSEKDAAGDSLEALREAGALPGAR